MAKTQKSTRNQNRAPGTRVASSTSSVPSGLRYVDNTCRGYTRKRIGGTFVYFDPHGEPIEDDAENRRINALAVPPAYTDVWICPDARGHLQATGRDARGRKQYRYHPLWRETREATKYERMQAFGAMLPRLRARMARDIALDGMPRNKVLATIVRLLDTTLIRVGGEEYARENRSYGLTTLRKRHLKVSSNGLRFRFRGKSGIEHDVAVSDARVARIVRLCMELAGQELFQYLDADGSRHSVNSSDINDYLHEVTGADFTAKDYRTWAGSVFALAALRKLEWETVAQAHRHVVGTIKQISQILRNTPAVCRKCYIHPAVIEAFEARTLVLEDPPARRRGLKADEAALIMFLKGDAKRRAREVSSRKRNGASSGPSLSGLRARSSQEARANGSKDTAKSDAVTSRKPAMGRPPSRPARSSAAKKPQRARSPSEVASR
ncbi:DNA topoisomerase IB [Paraburkholderia lycopersici]|uniref:DNA topoisomerase n=1 Tax=Paraburkholderia lycopersici TaxID=416944 RepID=A0A1G7CCE3_9BURK|nr:DNA topoisomerase IB [Paraburkholderia lycopersici]SDE36997.1 DNA topoisomerase-1 [Paraburkholderia lycopersici]